MPVLELKQACLGYGPATDRYEVLHNVNLTIEENEFAAIIGFSGSGKSTLMSILAGLSQPDSGEVLLDGKPIQGPGPELGMVFQNYSLLPWLSVFANVEIAVRQVFPRLTLVQRRSHVQRYLDLVNLSGSEWKKPSELSGGMRQRLSLARTLSMEPRILLLDEPLSALDALTRSMLQDEIIRLWEQERRTVVMITNDVDEAALMADRIIPLTTGPAATLSDPFMVDLPRPRDRTSLNFNADFKTLRSKVSQVLTTMGEHHQRNNQASRTPLPALVAKHQQRA